jgi:hypothetical protein
VRSAATRALDAAQSGAALCSVQGPGRGRRLARGLLGVRQTLVPARPLHGQRFLGAVPGQPGIGFLQGTPAGVQLGCFGMQRIRGLCRFGAHAIQVRACLLMGRGQRGQRGVQGLRRVQLRRGGGLGIDGCIQLASGVQQPACRHLLGVQCAPQFVLAARQLRLGLAPIGRQAVQVGKQRARRLYRFQRCQVAPTRGGAIDTGLGRRQRTVGLRFGGAQPFALLLPAQPSFKVEAVRVQLRQRGLGRRMFPVERDAGIRRERRLVLQA